MNTKLTFGRLALAATVSSALVACSAVTDGAGPGVAADGTSEESQGLTVKQPVDPGGNPDPGPIEPVPTPITPAPPPGPPPAPLVVTELAKGNGWSHTTAVGTGFDPTGTPTTYNGNYWIFKTRTALSATQALPPATMTALRNTMGVTPTNSDDDETIIISKASVDQIEANAAAASAAGEPTSEFKLCYSDRDEVYSRSFNLDKQFNYTKTTDGDGFTGSANLGAHVVGSLTGSISYTVKHVCIVPYIVVHKVSVAGNAKVVGAADIEGDFSKEWRFSRQIADPTLAVVPLPIIPIPITFELPVNVGLDATAKASVHADAEFTAQGNFQIDCRLSGCDGFKSGSTGFGFNGTPSVSAQATMHVTPWAEVDLKAYVVSDSLASAKVGLRASMPSDVFAYAGNTCGDADGDGVNEFVSGAAFNTNLNVQLNTEASIFGHSLVSRSYTLLNANGGFHMVANGGVFDPIVHAQGLVGTFSADLKASMRPCWPYDDIAIYEVAWGDGTSTPISNQVHTLFDLTHDYSTGGSKTISVQVMNDIGGRELGSSASRNVVVGQIAHIPPIFHL